MSLGIPSMSGMFLGSQQVALGWLGCPWGASVLSPGYEGCLWRGSWGPQGVRDVPMSLSAVPAVRALPHDVPEDGPALLVEECEAARHPWPCGRHCSCPHHTPGHWHHPHLEPLSPQTQPPPGPNTDGEKNQQDLCVCVGVYVWWEDTWGHGGGHR